MNVILYKYSCPRWYGTYSGIKNISIGDGASDEEIKKQLTEIENKNSGSRSCGIDLLQKYELSINNIQNYSGITTIPINNIKDLNKKIYRDKKNENDITCSRK